jgi:predicted DNA-binding protein (UPF0251 family)
MARVTGYKLKKAKQAGAVRKMTQTEAARVLRVSRGHLNRVIHGARLSRRLMNLFNELLLLRPKKTKSKT